ncbi:MAG: hypothetical protein US89_C0005G0050 [Candidatus Peregrinibacteria bacterium GW2011_GWF2_38_29]|nr:MAG: hypothetical protein US89_C0005G0050 [Candidatus Peregrinibacteria bacterium GW2011_GWF2_38_29]HBB02637.1 hypothetical protein [Candidatus Peregrinibacteria bacterium]
MLKQSQNLMEGVYKEDGVPVLRVINMEKGGLVELTEEQGIIFEMLKEERDRMEFIGLLGEEYEEQAERVVDELIRLGLVVDDEQMTEKKHPEIPEGIGTFKARALYLFTSDACNMDCAHCYVPEHIRHDNKRTMSPEVIKKTIDEFIEQAQAVGIKEIELRLLGGEPFFDRKLLLDALKYADEKTKEKGMDVKFVINTNATLCNEKTVEALKPFAEKLFMIVSLDGDEDAHNAQRPLRGGKPTYKLVIEGMKRLKEAGIYVCPHTVISSRNNDQIAELMEYIKNELGINQLSYSFMHVPDFAGDIGIRDLTSAEKMDIVRLTHEKAKELDMELTGHWKFSIAQSVTNSPSLCEGGISTICVTSNGDMFACQRHVGDSNKRLGNIMDGLVENLTLFRNQRLRQWLSQMCSSGGKGCVSCLVTGECGSKEGQGAGEEGDASVATIELQAYANQGGKKGAEEQVDDNFHAELLRYYLENCPTNVIRTTEFDTIVNGMQPR